MITIKFFKMWPLMLFLLAYLYVHYLIFFVYGSCIHLSYEYIWKLANCPVSLKSHMTVLNTLCCLQCLMTSSCSCKQ